MTRLFVLILALFAIGCNTPIETPNPTKPGTPELSRSVGQHITAAQYSATAAKAALPKAGAERSAAHIDETLNELGAAKTANEDVTEQAEREARAMIKAAARINELERKDPLVVALNWLAYGLIVAGAALIALHFFWLKLDWGDDAGAACLITGSVVAAVAHWMPTIRVVVLLLALGAGLFAAWRAWRKFRKTRKGS